MDLSFKIVKYIFSFRLAILCLIIRNNIILLKNIALTHNSDCLFRLFEEVEKTKIQSILNMKTYENVKTKDRNF